MIYRYDNRGQMTHAVRSPKAGVSRSGDQTIFAYERDNAGLIVTRRRYGNNPGDGRACTANSDCRSDAHW